MPYRNRTGVIKTDKEQVPYHFRGQWNAFQSKHCLPKLRPVDVRHWVATVCRKSNLSKVSSARLMGHDPYYGGSMRDWYDSPQDDDIIGEQREKLPEGPIGFLFPKVEIAPGLPEDALSMVSEYLSGIIGTMELMTRIEKLKNRQNEKTISAIQV